VSAEARKLEAIVLSTLDYGERDRIVRLLSAEQGRFAAMARGARGSVKRFGGVLDLGNRVEIVGRHGSGELWNLQSANLLSPRLRIREDIVRLALCTYACELCGALAQEEHEEPRLFGLLETFLTLLDALQGSPKVAFRLALEAKALSYAGWTPALDRCTRCGEKLSEPVVFDPGAGGAMHATCGAGQVLSLDFLGALDRLRRQRLRETLDDEVPAGPSLLLARFAEHHTGRGLLSLDFLLGLERFDQRG
jgi:DNA repair protein RecO (recombination protein O)